MSKRQDQWHHQETRSRGIILSLQGWWSGLLSALRKWSPLSGLTAMGAAMNSFDSPPKSPACASNSNESNHEISSQGASLSGPIQDSKIDCATSSGRSSPVQKVTILDRHGTLALIIASWCAGILTLALYWHPAMLTASQEKANARAQQAVITAELTKRDLEDLKRQVYVYKETGRWVEK